MHVYLDHTMSRTANDKKFSGAHSYIRVRGVFVQIIPHHIGAIVSRLHILHNVLPTCGRGGGREGGRKGERVGGWEPREKGVWYESHCFLKLSSFTFGKIGIFRTPDKKKFFGSTTH